MNGEDIRKFKVYSISLMVSTIMIYFLLNILQANWYISKEKANMAGCLILMMPLLLALYLPGIWGDDLELRRMRKRFKFSWKVFAIMTAVFLCGILAGFLVVDKYTEYTFRQYGMALLENLKRAWYTLLIGAVAIEAGFRGFLQTHFEKTYSVLGSSLMVGIVYAIWKTVLVFASDDPSLPCLLLLAMQFIEISVVLGYLMKWCRKNLYPVIGFHFAWNLMAHTMKFQRRTEFLLYADLFLGILCVLFVLGNCIKRKKLNNYYN